MFARDDGVVFYVPASSDATTTQVSFAEDQVGTPYRSRYYFADGPEATAHATKTSAFPVLTSAGAGTTPLMRVFYSNSCGWSHDELARMGLRSELAQCSFSYNGRAGTLRGMHYQAAPHGETKIVSCVRGAIYDVALDWAALADPLHRGVQRLVGDLNHLYRTEPALHALDADAAGFRWLVGDDCVNSVYAFYRDGPQGSAPLLAICNFTPVPRRNYRVGAPRCGRWREAINTDSSVYGGSNLGNAGEVTASSGRSHGQPFYIELTVPPLATLLLRFEPE